jgi:UPF0271 protein
MDLNCDLGELEPWQRTRALMRWIRSANIACGGHAGTVKTMGRSVRWAIQQGVRIGAHPGLPGAFGRAETRISGVELAALVEEQAGLLAKIARVEGTRLHHIKLHGALYHATEADDRLAISFVRAVKRLFPGVALYSLSNGRVFHAARRERVVAWGEFFADRNYLDDGRLVPRTDLRALIFGLDEIEARVREWLLRSRVRTVTGRWLALDARTVCVHGDTPCSLTLARRISVLIRCHAGRIQSEEKEKCRPIFRK